MEISAGRASTNVIGAVIVYPVSSCIYRESKVYNLSAMITDMLGSLSLFPRGKRRNISWPVVRQITQSLILYKLHSIQLPLSFHFAANVFILGCSLTTNSRICRQAKRLSLAENLNNGMFSPKSPLLNHSAKCRMSPKKDITGEKYDISSAYLFMVED